MRGRSVWPALLRELRQAPGRNRKLEKAVRYQVLQWEAGGDPRWLDLAVIAITESKIALPPTLQKLVYKAAMLRAHRRDQDYDGPDYDGYLIHLAERALDREKIARGPIDTVWRAVADGALSEVDAAEWARIISQRVVQGLLNKGGQKRDRGDAAITALGLDGSPDANYELREKLATLLSFLPYAHPDVRQKETWEERMYKGMRLHFPDQKKANVKKRLARLAATIPKNTV